MKTKTFEDYPIRIVPDRTNEKRVLLFEEDLKDYLASCGINKERSELWGRWGWIPGNTVTIYRSMPRKAFFEFLDIIDNTSKKILESTLMEVSQKDYWRFF